jgi:23S rRNA (uracil1939-C5)-methyltransferase
MDTEVGAELEVRTHALAVGCDAVARADDGRVVFVAGALPDERVRVRVRSAHARFAHADVIEVVSPSADRIVAVCPHVARGCGGCGWAHVDVEAQRRAKVAMVSEALVRLGGIDDPVVEPGPDLAVTEYRTTVRAAIVDGRAGYRMANSDDRLAVDSCRVAHALVEELLVAGDFGPADEVVLRAGARTGERMVRVTPTAAQVSVPEDVLVVGTDALTAGARAWIHEEVAGVRFRISADSFFQSRADGADALVAAVSDALGAADPEAPMVDLYCGVGLFAATVGRGRRVQAVERSRSSVADAQVNLAGLDAKVVRVGVERWRPSPAGVVVADPPRSGLKRVGVDKIGATGATHLALVSCDAGSLGRDAGLLRDAGWILRWSRLVDIFPDTPHVEVVSHFVR